MTHTLIAARQLADRAPALPRIDKWTLFHDLCTARAAYGLSDRSLSVLNALLSFLPARTLDDDAALVVFPSNAALADRAHGMAESTLRRHLAALVQAGLIWRQDSPNGKRFARRDRSGARTEVFGFDLRPLLLQADDIARQAAALQEQAETLRRAREGLVLRLRDAAKLLAHGQDSGLPGDWDSLAARLVPIRAALRRRMDAANLAALVDQTVDILRILSALCHINTENPHGSAAHSGRLHHNSKEDSAVLEPCQELAKAADVVPDPDSLDRAVTDPTAQTPPALPLQLVLKACPDILPYARDGVRNWRDLVGTAGAVRGMMGISAHAWTDAQDTMGAEHAAIAVSAMLQRFDRIQNPGGYLRALTARAATGGFSPGPMVMALLRDGR